ncbi:MAG: M1 family aminopeptidase [Ktedonobacterales bacterium]
MRYCGSRRLASALLAGEELAENATSFSLPGDQPRYAPDRPADTRHVDIAVALDFDARRITGDVTTDFTALFEHVTEVGFDAAELDIAAVTLGGAHGAALDYWTHGEKLFVRLDRAYTYGEQFSVRVRYSAAPRTGLVFVHPTEGDPDLPVQVWTQGETEYHHFWFPCHDFPNERATTALHATVPGTFFALSNGKLEGATKHKDGTRTYNWRMEVPFPAYLVTLVAGEFSEIADYWRDTPVNYYVRAGREDDGKRMLGKTPRMIEYFSTHFGVDYPYVKYGQIVSELFLGAMENASATTHSYRLLPDKRASLDFNPEDVVAHELVHQWHGDLLAVRDWSHTWLKEGFATYFETTWTEEDLGADERQAMLYDNLHIYLDADKRGRRPIVYNVYRKNASELFDRNVYQKASLCLHMLRFVVGEQPFWRGIQLYTQRNAGREVITADLERAVEEATGRSLAQFFEQWFYKAGHPEFKVSYAWDDEQRVAKLTVEQTQKTDAATPLFVTPVEIGFFVPEADGARADDPDTQAALTTFRVTLDEQRQTFHFTLPRRPLSVRFDQGSWLLKTLDFPRPAELLREQLRRDPDVLGRVEAAEALGALADPRSIAALEEALFAEQFWLVRGAIARALGEQKSERALRTLLKALDQIDEPKARRALVEALGNFRVPEHAALANEAAGELTRIVNQGDPSYFVEAAACVALGKTRTEGAYATLLAKIETGSWRETIRGGVFHGLGELADPRAADVLTGWLLDRQKPLDARAAAAGGLRALAATHRFDRGGAVEMRAVDALIAALHDPWEMTVRNAIAALVAWGDPRAIAPIEHVAASTLDEHIVRDARHAVRALQQGRTSGEESRTLRDDLDGVREENRKLRERLASLEYRVNQPHPPVGDAQSAQ